MLNFIPARAAAGPRLLLGTCKKLASLSDTTPCPCVADAYHDNKLAFTVTCAVILAALFFLLGALVLCCRIYARQRRAKQMQVAAKRSKATLHRPSRGTSLAPIAERRNEGEGPGPWWGRLQRDKSHQELAHRAWRAEGPEPAAINIKAAALVSQASSLCASVAGWHED